MKRLLGILLVLVLCAGLLPAPVYAASGTDQNIKWTVKNDVLTISGKGVIPNYWSPLFGANPPWRGQPYEGVGTGVSQVEQADGSYVGCCQGYDADGVEHRVGGEAPGMSLRGTPGIEHRRRQSPCQCHCQHFSQWHLCQPCIEAVLPYEISQDKYSHDLR